MEAGGKTGSVLQQVKDRLIIAAGEKQAHNSQNTLH